LADEATPDGTENILAGGLQGFRPGRGWINQSAANRCRSRLVHWLERPTDRVFANVFFNAKAQRRNGAKIF
jgi:hypothetical protein